MAPPVSTQSVYRPRNVLLAAFIAVALGGCGGDDVSPTDADRALRRQATESTEAPTTTVPVDPFAIPETIDAAYVERVANELYRVIGDARRLAQRQRAMPPESVDRFNAAYDPEVAQSYVDAMVEDVTEGFAGVRDVPGDIVVQVTGLTQDDPTCIVADITFDPSAALVEPRQPEPLVLTLRRLDEASDPHGYNETPWVIWTMVDPEAYQPELHGCAP